MPDLEARQAISALETEVGLLTSLVNELSSRLAMIGLLYPGGEIVQPSIIDFHPDIDMRLGNGLQPGYGFSGIRIAYPPVTYGGVDWNLVGIENDTLQAGIRASDGKIIAGAGTVILDDQGVTIEHGEEEINWIKWYRTGDVGPLARLYAYYAIPDTHPQMHLMAGHSGVLSDHAVSTLFLHATAKKETSSSPTSTLSVIAYSGASDDPFLLQFYNTREGVVRNYLDITEKTINWNKSNADIDWAVHGDTVDDILKVDAGLDKAYYKGVEIGTGSGGGGDILEVQVFS